MVYARPSFDSSLRVYDTIYFLKKKPSNNAIVKKFDAKATRVYALKGNNFSLDFLLQINQSNLHCAPVCPLC